MSSNTPESQGPESGGLQSMLSRLKGMLGEEAKPEEQAEEQANQPPNTEEGAEASSEKPEDEGDAGSSEETTPETPDIPLATPPMGTPAVPQATPPECAPVVPTAAPVEAVSASDVPTVEVPAAEVPQATPVVPSASPISEEEAEDDSDKTPTDPAIPIPKMPEPKPEESAPAEVAEPVVTDCPICGSARVGASPSCDDCGYHFPEVGAVAVVAGGSNGATSASGSTPGQKLRDRFEIGALINERFGVSRFQGLDNSTTPPTPVVILEEAKPEEPAEAQPVEEVPDAEAVAAEEDDEEILPSFDDFAMSPSPDVTEVLPARPQWPSVEWEYSILHSLEHPSLPSVVDRFESDTHQYVVEEVPTGQSLWDGWDDPDVTTRQRYGWLVQVAEALHALHHCQTMLEGLRPDIVVISEDGQARLSDLSDLLPIPIMPNTPIRGTLYTAPELMSGQGNVDARADMYSFGAMMYALHVGRELSDIDFERPGHPKPFIPQFPDIHPTVGRLMSKTYRREPAARFPTDEASREDATGFLELIKSLNVVGRTLDTARLEIASWTNTGMIRTGNEDGFALLHATEARQDDLGEAALILLCDGMGGYEAGEVAAALSIKTLREILLQEPMFAAVAGKSPFPSDPLASPPPTDHAPEPLDVERCKDVIKEALRETNRRVVQAGKESGNKRRAMGCTAEVVYIDGRNIVVGHVGDSRTYHLHEGRLKQLTRDQTLVNRLVELGTLTAEEAEEHPRRNELQQAIGGQPDVDVGVYSATLLVGDWVIVCSDGLTGHVKDRTLQEMLFAEAWSAETAARRLVNLTNIEGATDNVTVVAVRAT